MKNNLLIMLMFTLVFACGSSSLIEKTKNTRLPGHKFTKIGDFLQKYPEFTTKTWKKHEEANATIVNFEATFVENLAPFYNPVKLSINFKYPKGSKKVKTDKATFVLVADKNINNKVFEIAKLKSTEKINFDFDYIINFMKDNEGRLFSSKLKNYQPKVLIEKAITKAAENFNTEDIKTMVADGFSFENSSAIANLLNKNKNKNEDKLAEIIEILLKNKANPDAEMKGMVKPIAWAVTNNKLKIASLLISNNASGDAKLKNGENLLAWAATNNKLSLVKKLLVNKANPNSFIYGIDWTILMWAVNENHYSLANILLKNGADVNIQSGDKKNTALMQAVYKNDAKMVKKLLKYKPNKSLKDANGLTAYHIALKKGYTKISNLLK